MVAVLEAWRYGQVYQKYPEGIRLGVPWIFFKIERFSEHDAKL